ncbi:hypothetical protein N9C35_04235 [Flavobacteriaceae bacterium]|nr:hypothetical protein [Flavobacteriaceae bacterium]
MSLNNEELENFLSSERISKYKKIDDNWFKIYLKDIELAKSFYSKLHFLEIFLRNVINREFIWIYGDKWFIPNKIRSDLIFNYREENKLNDILALLNKQRKEINYHNIISNLNLGFWTNLFHKSYNNHIWQQNDIVLKIFPHLKSSQRNINNIHKDMNIIRKFRNRIFHFQSLINTDTKTIHKLIDKYIYGLSKINNQNL